MLTRLYLLCLALIGEAVFVSAMGGPTQLGVGLVPLSILIIVTPFVWLGRAVIGLRGGA